MYLIRGLQNIDLFRNRYPESEIIATIGNFDGLHLGHQKLFNLARKYKKQIIAVCGYEDKNASKKLGLKKVYTILERSNSIKDAIV